MLEPTTLNFIQTVIIVSPTQQFSPEESLAWLACRYVLRELSDAETRAWESRLAEGDEAACAAVAEASRLLLGLQAALPIPAVATPHSTRSQQRASTISLAMLLTSAVAVVFACWVSSPSPSRIDDNSAVALVSLWRDSGPLTRRLADADALSVSDFDAAADGVTVPGWLLAAVSLENSQNGAAGDEVWEDN